VGVDCHDQRAYRVRLVWGRRGARAAAARGDTLVVVDTLSFSTAVVTAVAHGATVWPCRDSTEGAALAARHDAELAVSRPEVPAKGRFSLSPATLAAVERGTRVVLPSLNGATCVREASGVSALLAGALVNADAVAGALRSVAGPITVLACGERWPGDGKLRFAVEDYLGAGAILAGVDDGLSPEAAVCAAAFRAVRERLPEAIGNCASGLELDGMGFAEDVARAATLDAYDVAPRLTGGGAFTGG
jgi:2-phosphosulfolactate phosphatase